MEQVFKDLPTRSVFAWLGVIVLVFAIADLGLHSHRSVVEPPLLILAIWVGTSMYLGTAVYKAAQKGPAHVLTVCVWSSVIVLVGIVCAYSAFFMWEGSSTAGADKILNVVPVLVALWAAGLGWFVHYQWSSKAHRSKNSFDVLMQIRTNTEVRRHAEVVTLHFPPGSRIPKEYEPYFPHTSLRDLNARRVRGEEVPEIEFERAKAIVSLKYMLNHLEFIAAGVYNRDLDEDLLYETISITVVGTYKRAKSYVEYIQRAKDQGGLGEMLAFCHLDALSEKWDAAYDQARAARKRPSSN